MAGRRDFLKQASLAVAGGLTVSGILSGYGFAWRTPKKHIGLQLYSLRDDIYEHGIQKVLEAVAEMGYVNLETAGGYVNDGKIYQKTPAEFKKMVADLGMHVTSAHLSHNMTDNHVQDMDWWNRAVETHSAAGLKYMVVASSPLSGDRATLDNVKRHADYYNEIGLITAAASIRFGYHNHAFEFENKIDGTPVYDLLIEATSPRHVMFQNDVYWTKKGGYDPVDYLKKYPDRIKVLHIKDERTIGASGTMDFKPIFDQAYASGVSDWYVEIEEYDNIPMEDVKNSYLFLADAAYVK